MKSLLIAILGFCSLTHAQTCGISGSVEERIQNCSSLEGAKVQTSWKATWILVSRAENGNEVWKDCGMGIDCDSKGLLWGDRLKSTYPHKEALTACASLEAASANAGITEQEFHLPTYDEYYVALHHGIVEVLPHMTDESYWASTTFRDKFAPNGAANIFLSYGGAMVGSTYAMGSPESVRCVGF